MSQRSQSTARAGRSRKGAWLGIAIAAIGLFAVAAPAAMATSVPTGVWEEYAPQQGLVPIKEAKQIQLKGKAAIIPEGGGSGYDCDVSVGATLYPAGYGEVTSFTVSTNTCSGYGSYKGCIAEGSELLGNPNGNPLLLAKESKKATLSKFGFKVDFENCFSSQGHEFKVQATGDWSPYVETNGSGDFKGINLEGEATSTIGTIGYQSGILKVSPSGTYGLGALAGPGALTEPGPWWAGDVGASEATIHAAVNPRGLATTYQFEYGTTASYGSKAPASAKSIGSGTKDVAVKEALTGLEPETTYHFRVKATNSNGTTYGVDQTFTTGLLRWTNEGEPLESPAEVEFEGTFGFESLGAGVICGGSGALTLEPEVVGTFSQGAIAEPEEYCVGFGLFEGCTIEAVDVSAPLEMTAVSEEKVILKGLVLEAQSYGCISEDISVETPTVTLVPKTDKSGGITSLEVGLSLGTANFRDLGIWADSEVFGNFELSEPGDYGLELVPGTLPPS